MERLGQVEAKHKKEIALLQDKINVQQQDITEKSMEILRLGERVQKTRLSEENNLRFL